MLRRSYLIIIIVFVCFSSMLWAQRKVLEMRNLGSAQVEYAGFVLQESKAIHIEAIGSGGAKSMVNFKSFQADPENMYAYAWIINTENRELVWRMSVENTQKIGWSGFNRKFDNRVQLPPGNYEVYFSSVEPLFIFGEGGFISFNQLLKKLLGRSNEWDEEATEWMVRVSGVDEVLSARDVNKIHTGWLNETVVSIVKQGDDVFEHRGFTLKKPARLQVYALGEGASGKMYDYGWIINADTHERIWIMDEKNSDYAGGARKNRVVKEEIEFKPGNYLVYYKTDDSHSSEEWNANPPYDPFFWGVTLKPVHKDFDWSIVEKYARKEENVVVEISRMGNLAYQERLLEVVKPTKIRIFALGEGRSGEMYDYGWLTRAGDGAIVWKMEYDQTRHAGGSSKNRFVDEIITLLPGLYMVHYQTDDSHSYESWNAFPPQDPEKWGITIYHLGEKDNIREIRTPHFSKKNILVQLIGVGDDEKLRKDFTLQKPTKLRIYCIGEGDDGEMYDYGWIKNMDTGSIVWKMVYRQTVSAGGARKNRLSDLIIHLPPGNYRAYYRSDDSHSFTDWNAPPPYDSRNYGITIFQVE